MMAARKRQLQPVPGPEKDAGAFRTISEVADELDVRKHVLRFWEGKFPQLKPMKRAGNRRLYRPEDLELLLGIKHLLHGEGYTIKGVQRILKEDGVDAVKTLGKAVVGPAANAAAHASSARASARKPATPAEAKRSSTAPTPLRPRPTQSVPVLRDAVEIAIKELEASRMVLLGETEGSETPARRGATRQR